MKRYLSLISLLVACLLFISGCSSESNSGNKSAGTKVMKLGIVTNKDRSLTKGLYKFGEIVEKETGGTIKVEVFSDGVLGGDRQVIEALQMGTVHGTAVSTGVIAAFAPRMDVFDLPFLFKDKATAYKVFDGPIGQELLQDLPKAGLIGLAYWENGFRHLTNNKREVKTADDIKGLKIRTLESKVHVETWRLLGANPTPIAFSQLYSALEQGVVDGQENPYGNVVASQFYEVQKYLTNTGHIYNANVFMVSKVFWDSLTDKEREIIKKAAIEARDYQRKLNDEEDKSSIAYLKEKGMKISDLNPGEQEKIKQMLQPLYKQVAASIGGDLVDRLIAATKQ
ncbi:TRAP transporter substrate-binding protein [Sporolituus thermophilus]|uniref:Tripartite ATP-independent transporter solute receptor, DctP family n=1 Tax=Sporolituus thermophilus DSM 23256 TaxID=1123285 RepID=A0A1G7LA31_9FIRM|nr:TRAP transporter substrate-binding protein [Sporolituus thermophilus]SDF46348.1 tripartite ATP-independent transporter solute receptor, DctP family [Sporolituus thermophilus DSM 23256]